jgi:hypothetical protein
MRLREKRIFTLAMEWLRHPEIVSGSIDNPDVGSVRGGVLKQVQDDEVAA